MNRFKDLTGKKVGLLTVVEIAKKDRYNRFHWKCICECGKETIISSNSLISKKTKSCGHLVSNKLPEGESLIHHLFLQYKKGAPHREIEFNLSKEEFRYFIDKNCHYCGVEPKSVLHHKTCKGVLIYNGIDRKDSNKGYTLDNCVSCCSTCNRIKNHFDYHFFINHIKKIYEYTFEWSVTFDG